MTGEMTREPMSNNEMIDTLKGLVFGTFDRTTVKERHALDMAIKALEQEPKTGHWIDHQEDKWIYAKCSECGTVHDTQTNYCPNCGARMSESKYCAELAKSFAQGLRQGLQDGFSESEGV